MNSLELKDKKSQLKNQALQLIERCKTEIRSFTEAEAAEYEKIKQEINTVNTELRNLENQLGSENTADSNNAVFEAADSNKTKIKMEKNFSLIKAIRSVANNKQLDELSNAVIEAGASEMRKAGLNYTGQIQLPMAENRAAITVATEGEDVVATDLFDVIKPLHAKNVMVQAGAKLLTGLVGDLQYPVMSAGSCLWEGETDEAQDGAPTFTNVKFSPKRLATVVPISKQFLLQDSVGAENAIREEIVNAINAKLEATILGNGAGSSTEPKGLFPNEGDSGLTAITDFKSLTEMEAGMEDANVYGELKYILSPKAKADLRAMSKGTKSTQLVYEAGEVDGTPAYATSHLKDKHVVYGDMSQYLIAQWGNIDITVDNVTLAAQGQIRLVVNAYFDMKPLRAEAIKVAKVGA